MVPARAGTGEVDLSGRWDGAIELPGVELGLIVHFRSDGEGGWAGSVDIPMQGASDLPVTHIALEDGALRFSLPTVPGDASFRGEVAAGGDRIAGEFTQAGQTFPMRLERAAVEEEAAVPEDPLEGFDEYVARILEEWDVPGIAVAVVRDDEVVLARGYGLRDVERELPVTERTIFAIGSATKAFTATVLATLVEEGKLSWDEPVVDHLPGFRLHDPVATREMTPVDLLTHRSGLPRHDLAWYGSDRSRRELFASLRHLEPSAGFRERFQYQNLMYLTAGLLAEELGGASWEELVRRRILAPLGMAESQFSVEASQRAEDFAQPYQKQDDEVTRFPFRSLDAIGPAGSINSNVAEMARWLKLQLGGGEVDGARVVSAATLDLIHTPRVVVAGASPVSPELSPPNYALGWMVQTYRGHLLLHHGGGIDGFSALVAFLPREKLGVVALSNLGGTPVPAILTYNLFDRFLELPEVDWHGRLRLQVAQMEAAGDVEAEEEAAALERQEGTRPAHELAAYAGDYEHAGYGTLRVTVEGDGLWARIHGLDSRLEHWHFETFRSREKIPVVELKIPFTFVTDRFGEVSRVEVPVEAQGPEIVFRRRPPAELTDAAFLERLAGAYELGAMALTVAVRGDGTLTLTVPGQPAYELEPERGTRFSLRGLSGFAARFELGHDGRAVRLVLIQPNGVFRAERRD